MTTPRSRPWRVVVTDDDPKLMAFLVTTLRGAGHYVFAGYDGQSACELALMLPDVDMLVTNTRIGEVAGRELILSVRRERPGFPVLHIGKPLPNPDAQLSDIPTLQEPFTADQLLKCASNLLARQHT
jgi:DNA-binding NtrC family response regulator